MALATTIQHSSAWTSTIAIEPTTTTANTNSIPRVVVVAIGRTLLAILDPHSKPIAETPLFGSLFDAALVDWQCFVLDQIAPVKQHPRKQNTGINARLAFQSFAASQMLVVTSDSGYLTFLAVLIEDEEGSGTDRGDDEMMGDEGFGVSKPRFEAVYQIQIAPPGLDYTSPGQKIAVDPCSRAIAVLAHQSIIELFIVTSTTAIPFAPVDREHCITIHENGIGIWDALFLYPEPQNLNLITLAVLVCKDGDFSILVYEHNRSTAALGFQSHVTRFGPFKLPDGFIPTKSSALRVTPLSFLVLSDSMDVLVVQVARESGSSLLSINRVVSFVLQASVVEAVAQDLEADRDSYPLISGLSPISTSSETSESFYISTDAGHLIHLQITPSPNGWTCSPHLISRRHPVSHLSLLPRQHQDQPNQDILILLGDMCDGEFLAVDYTAETVSRLGQEITNSAPVLDFKVCSTLAGTPKSSSENNNKSYGFIRKEKSGCGVGRDKMYLTSGCSPNGRIRELQCGLNVVVEAVAGAEEDDADGSVSGDSAEGGFKGITGLWNLKKSPDDGHDSLLGISFLSETRLLYLLDDTLEDVSETSGLELHFASLLIASLEGGGNSGDMEDALVVQVWRGGVVVARPTYFEMQERQESVNWAVDCGEVVTLAAMYGQYLFLGIGKVVVLLHVSPTASDDGNLATIVQVSRITLEEEPSSLSCTILEGYSSTICLVGTYEPSVIVLEVNDSEELIRKESLSLASLSQGEIRVPNSIRLLTVGLDSFIAIGLRNGTLAVYRIKFSATGIQFDFVDSVKVGIEPVRLIPGISESDILVVSNKLWRVALQPNPVSPSSTNAIRRPPLQITSICFDTLRIGTPFHQSQSYLHSSNTQAWTYIFATPDSLSFVSLDVNNNNNSCPPPPRIRSLPITKTPRRIIHDTATGTLIIACNTRLRGKDVLTGEIKLVDPKTGVQYLREVLPKGEACYSMTIWNIKDQKRYICIGTWGYQENPGGGGASRSGRVLVYSLKETESRSENKPPFRIRKLGEYVLPEMVFAVCSFMKSYLLAASGNCLYQLKIEATSRTLHCGAKTELRYPIRSLSVSGSHIFVGGANDSISLYLFDARTKQFTFCKSDDITRSPSDCLSLSPTKVLVADKSGNVFCLGGGSDSSQITNNESLCFKTKFCINMGEIIMRLHVGQLDTGFEGTSLGLVSLVEDEDRDQNLVADDDDNGNQENITLSVGNQPHHQYHPDRVAKKLTAVYACSIVGSVFAFRGIKDSRVYTRLKELQNVLAVYPSTRPLLGNDYQRFRGGAVKMGKGLAGSGMLNVIDGDLVKRWSVLSVLEKKQVLDEMSGDDDEMLSWIDGFVEGLISMG